MNDKLKSLYHTVILKHNSEPFHFEKRQQSSHTFAANNPVCGDRFQVYLEINEGRISDVFFHGYGCAISKASTSVLVHKLNGLPVIKALALCRDFLSCVEPGGKKDVELNDEFAAFTAARDFPGRLKCATLAWDEMKSYLENNL